MSIGNFNFPASRIDAYLENYFHEAFHSTQIENERYYRSKVTSYLIVKCTCVQSLQSVGGKIRSCYTKVLTSREQFFSFVDR